MAGKESQLTSVKVHPLLFEDFKVKSIRTKITFQKLVDRTLHLYVTDKEFQKVLDNHLETFYTGSKID